MRPERLRWFLSLPAVLALSVMASGCGDGRSPEGGGPGGGTPEAEGTAGDQGSEPGRVEGTLAEEELGTLDPDDINLVLRWTTNAISAETRADQTPARTITSVTFDSVPGVDRMIIEFEEGGALPSHTVESFVRPLPHCVGGDTVRSRGPGLLRVRLPDVASDSSAAAPPSPVTGLGNVTSVHLTCLEGTTVEWVLDVEAATAYRVVHLSDPTRLAVDVRQPAADSGAQ
ncbi:MAG: AMIN-like domain-containing (lipo)protein [Gemmatimonadota bacterium]